GSFDTAGGPSAPDYFRRSEICRERLGPVLRRLTVNYPPIMFHPLNTITAYKGQIIYDTPATAAKAETPIPELTWIPAKGSGQQPKPTNTTDLQSLFVPTAPGPGPIPGSPPGYGPAPGPAPGMPAPAAGPGPLPGPATPLPAEQGAGR
ncbi:MAG: phospholipid/cholesterol/gamma-HCH transport system substrate-binding protein, partial [Mycobacterium sp.]|nr:phospholipid/cholesterol/gamma-HCH transport system substrate-binding protein [Mycobacterium sp.]